MAEAPEPVEVLVAFLHSTFHNDSFYARELDWSRLDFVLLILDQDFKFKQLRRLKITSDSSIKDAISLLAVSNKFGLVFVGVPNKLVAIKVEDVVRLDNACSDKERRSETGEYPSQEIMLPSSPSFIALSSDNLTLIVCVQRPAGPFGLFYDVRAFARQVQFHNKLYFCSFN